MASGCYHTHYKEIPHPSLWFMIIIILIGVVFFSASQWSAATLVEGCWLYCRCARHVDHDKNM